MYKTVLPHHPFPDLRSEASVVEVCTIPHFLQIDQDPIADNAVHYRMRRGYSTRMPKLYPFVCRPCAQLRDEFSTYLEQPFLLKVCKVVDNPWRKIVMLLFSIGIPLLISLPCTWCASLVRRLDRSPPSSGEFFPPSSGGVFPPPSGGVFPPSSGENISFKIMELGPNTFFCEGYTIHNCGRPQDASSKANQVLGFLIELKVTLKHVVIDAQQGIRSRHGFAAFFKSNSNIRHVANALRSVLKGRPIIISAERAASDQGPRARPPTFMCINEGDETTAEIMAECKEVKKGPLGIWPGTEVMALCPDAFNKTLHPYATRTCPTLDRNGKFKPGDVSLVQGLFAKMVYSLVTMYYPKMYETYVDWDSLKDMQYAVELNARHSLLNRESYGFYAGGKGCPPHCAVFTVLRSFES